jgi:hypothetical protein
LPETFNNWLTRLNQLYTTSILGWRIYTWISPGNLTHDLVSNEQEPFKNTGQEVRGTLLVTLESHSVQLASLLERMKRIQLEIEVSGEVAGDEEIAQNTEPV